MPADQSGSRTAIRVILGEDETLLREGLSILLSRGGFEVVGAAGDAAGLIGMARRLNPDLVISDVRMPPRYLDDGLRAVLEIRQLRPGTAIVVLSRHLQRSYAMELLSRQPAGVGYLLKQRIADVLTFCRDLERVCAGGTVLDPEVVALMVGRTGQVTSLQALTARQQEVLALIAQGRSNAAIARALSVTERAVVQHASRIYDLLGLPASGDDHRRVLAVLRDLAG